jgi:hypothetical protein
MHGFKASGAGMCHSGVLPACEVWAITARTKVLDTASSSQLVRQHSVVLAAAVHGRLGGGLLFDLI